MKEDFLEKNIYEQRSRIDIWNKFFYLMIMIIGFAACFSWSGPIELKIILMLIFILLIYTWNQIGGSTRHLDDMLWHIMKQQAKLMTMIYELRSHEVSEAGEDETVKLAGYLDHINRYLEVGFVELVQSEKLISLCKVNEKRALAWILLEISIASILGWLLLWIIGLFAQ